MPFPWNMWPWNRDSDLNVAYWIKQLEEISRQAVEDLTTLEEWKTGLEQSLETWKSGVLTAISTWENEFTAAMALWKTETEGDLNDWKTDTQNDIAAWEADTLAALNTWKAAFIADYESLEARVSAIVSSTEDMIENLAPPFSTSTTYKTGDYTIYNGLLYVFTADHSGAWDPSHVSQRTAMGDIYAIKDAQKLNFSELNSYNLLDNLVKNDRSAHNVVWTWRGESCTVTGTASQTENNNLFMNQDELPEGFIPGKTYKVRYSSVKVRLRIYDYSGGTLNELLDTRADGEFTIPSTCTGFIIRLVLGSGMAANETITPIIYNTPTNAELDAMLAKQVKRQSRSLLVACDVDADIFPLTKNLLNPQTLTSGYILVQNVPTPVNNYYYSDYIKTGNVSVYYRDQGASISNLMSCYDEDYNYLGAVDYASNHPDNYERIIVSDGSAPTNYYRLQTLPGTVYIRVNGRYTSNLMLTPYFYPKYYIPYGYLFKKGSHRIAFFGDSVLLGTNGNGGGPVEENIPFWVNQKTYSAFENYGEGSMGWVSTEYSQRIAYDALMDVNLSAFDVIVLCYGVNDSAATMGAWNSSDENTIMGQVNKCIKKIGADNPSARIILVGPWNGAKYGSFPEWRYAVQTSGGFTRQQLNDTIKQTAEYYHAAFIDQKDSPYNAFGIGTVQNQKTGPFLGSDLIHPSPKGYKAIGEWMAAKLDAIIK